VPSTLYRWHEAPKAKGLESAPSILMGNNFDTHTYPQLFVASFQGHGVSGSSAKVAIFPINIENPKNKTHPQDHMFVLMLGW